MVLSIYFISIENIHVLYLEKFYLDNFTATENLYDTSNFSINLTKESHLGKF